MMNLEKIEVLVKPYPISNNEYVSYILQLSKYSQKQQQLFKNFYLEIIKKAIKLNETDDFPVENYRIWINGEKISPQIIEQLNLKLAIKALNELEINHYQEEIPQKETPSPVTYQLSNAEEYFLTRLKKIKEEAISANYECFYYYNLSIPDEYLFTQVNGYKKIKEEYLPYLRYLDLSDKDFSNMDLRNLDLSYTNISKIDFSNCYSSSIENINLEGVNLLGSKLKNISALGANLCGTYLEIEEESVNLKNCKLDKSIILTENSLVVDASKRGYAYVKYIKPPQINY